MRRRAWIGFVGAAACLAAMLPSAGDERSDGQGAAEAVPEAGFHFARLAYSEGNGGYRFGRGSWLIDYPQAEYHFSGGARRLTRVEVGDPVVVELGDDRIFDYPWLYAVEVGRWYLSEMEARELREYLLRGGFLMVDDFHGSYEWMIFLESMKRVFPDRPIVEISEGEEVLHVLYDLDQRTQIPGIGALMRGGTHEKDGVVPHWRGIYDDEDRLMVAINHNMDLGDAWEHADDPRYPQPMTALAYRFAMNYLIYAMTH